MKNSLNISQFFSLKPLAYMVAALSISLFSSQALAIDANPALTFDAGQDVGTLITRGRRTNIAETTLTELTDLVAGLGFNLTDPGTTNILAVAETLTEIAALVDRRRISENSGISEGDGIPEGSELTRTIGLLQEIESAARFVAAIKTLAPESGGGSSAGATAVSATITSVIVSRQVNIRNSHYETGAVAGEKAAITGFWVQAYDKNTEQEIREGVDGFDVDMYGIALGIDGPIDESTTVGFAVSYADSDVLSTGIENNELAIDSFQISSYASFNDDDYYMDVLISYSRNEYDSDRYLFNGLTASADYNGDQYGIRVRGGYPFVFGSGLHVIPNTTLEYGYLAEEAYQERGAGNLGLDVEGQALEALVWSAGIKLSYPFTTESDATWMPDFHIEANHDFIADEVELDTNFVGVGGAGFIINGASVEATSYKAGIGLRTWSQSALNFMFRYDYIYKKDYNSQSYAATIRYSF